MVKDVHNPPTNREPYTVEYAYDHQGRMVWKQVSANAVVLSTRNLVWDNHNIIAETIQNPQSQITNCYVWGLDLSGSLQGAGGVGGLLAVTTVSNPGTLEPLNPETFFPCFDANGNVTEYVEDSGTIAAHYEYSPFGETVVQSGDLADSFTHRFSTRPWCDITGLSEYLFRKYSPGMGRWLSRDPIQENTGLNAYVLCNNNIIDKFDIVGLISVSEANSNCADVKGRMNSLKTGDVIIDKLLKDLHKEGCAVGITCTECCGSGDQCGGRPACTQGYNPFPLFFWQKPSAEIQVCSDRVVTEGGDMNGVLRHELVHALQHCKGVKIVDCKSCMCQELGAGYAENPDPNFPRKSRLLNAAKSCTGKPQGNVQAPCGSSMNVQQAGSVFSDDEYWACIVGYGIPPTQQTPR